MVDVFAGMDVIPFSQPEVLDWFVVPAIRACPYGDEVTVNRHDAIRRWNINSHWSILLVL